jgi:PAS domain S-box-containing protein
MLTETRTVCDCAGYHARLLALIDDAVILVDADGLITGWSHGAEIMFGDTSTNTIGRCSSDLYIESERKALRAHFQTVLVSNEPLHFATTVAAKSGELLAVQVELLPMCGADRVVNGLLCHLRTTREQAERPDLSRHQILELLKLIDSAPIAFSHLDANRRFRYANQASLDFMGCDSHEIAGRHIQDVIGEHAYNAVLPEIDEVLKGKASNTELAITGEDGRKRHFYRTVYPDFSDNGQVVGYYAALLDITEAKMEEEYQLRREQVLRATLVREINHRVKNSLQGIIGMMRLQAGENKPAGDVIEQCISQLMAVGVAFGLASRHGEAQVLLCDMVLEIAHNVEQASRCSIPVDLSPAAIRHPVSLTERHSVNISLVINELLFNAVKHSSVSALRAINVRVDRDDESAIIAITNETGLLPEDFSLESGTGLGTGLSLVKALIPPESCELTISQGHRGVTARLRLESPVLPLQAAVDPRA